MVHLRAHEAVEVVEAFAGGPPVERAHRGDLAGRGLMPFAERGGAVAVALQDLGKGGSGAGTESVVSRRRGGHLRRAAHADRVVIASRQQRLAGGRAQRSDVEAGVPQPAVCKPVGGGHLARPAECARGAESEIVHHHDHHVGRPARRLNGRHRGERGSLLVDAERGHRRLGRVGFGEYVPVCVKMGHGRSVAPVTRLQGFRTASGPLNSGLSWRERAPVLTDRPITRASRPCPRTSDCWFPPPSPGRPGIPRR